MWWIRTSRLSIKNSLVDGTAGHAKAMVDAPRGPDSKAAYSEFLSGLSLINQQARENREIARARESERGRDRERRGECVRERGRGGGQGPSGKGGGGGANLNPQPEPSPLTPQPSPLNPQPSTLNPQPQTLNLKPPTCASSLLCPTKTLTAYHCCAAQYARGVTRLDVEHRQPVTGAPHSSEQALPL